MPACRFEVHRSKTKVLFRFTSFAAAIDGVHLKAPESSSLNKGKFFEILLSVSKCDRNAAFQHLAYNKTVAHTVDSDLAAALSFQLVSTLAHIRM